uniref:Uncharacterized protein n=1 Tax=Fagus sylvatica TaxID=28930 RepID=A0A2N9GWW4_FAGSY
MLGTRLREVKTRLNNLWEVAYFLATYTCASILEYYSSYVTHLLALALALDGPDPDFGFGMLKLIIDRASMSWKHFKVARFQIAKYLAMAKEPDILVVLQRGAIHEVLSVQISVADPTCTPWSCQST